MRKIHINLLLRRSLRKERIGAEEQRQQRRSDNSEFHNNSPFSFFLSLMSHVRFIIASIPFGSSFVFTQSAATRPDWLPPPEGTASFDRKQSD
jgi:hypothetical protein